MQSDMAEIAGLMQTVLVIEEQPHAVGRVIIFRLDLFVGEESDMRIGVAEQRNEFFRHPAGEPAVMAFLELHRIGKPAERVAQRADRKLNEYVAVRGRVIMNKDALAVLPRLDAEADVIALAAIDATGLELRLKQRIAGVEIAQAHAPGMLGFFQHDATAIVEIETEALRACLRRQLRRRRIGALGCGPTPRPEPKSHSAAVDELRLSEISASGLSGIDFKFGFGAGSG